MKILKMIYVEISTLKVCMYKDVLTFLQLFQRLASFVSLIRNYEKITIRKY